MKHWHKRGNIVSFLELSAEQQNDALAYNGDDGAQGDFYLVMGDTIDDYYLLETFMVSPPRSRYDGVAHLTNTSALGIVIGRDYTQAIIQCFS